jgi:3alpha(or 20beta)-hydroxysteroid dehydrogenase
MAGRLAGKTAIVTGGARGQGAAAARAFVAEGASVLITDVLDEEGAKLAAELGESAAYRTLDVRDEQSWVEAVADAETRYGAVNVLLNNAGVLHFSMIEDTSLADFERVVRINQVGPFLGMKTCIPAMRRAGGGSIINVSSVEGLAGMALLSAYASTKFAIRGMTKVAAVELGAHGIRVNSIHPGAIDTHMVSSALGDTPIDMSLVGAMTPMGRVGQPEEVAQLVLFLASDESSYCTGGEFAVDGGATATHSFWTKPS